MIDKRAAEKPLKALNGGEMGPFSALVKNFTNIACIDWVKLSKSPALMLASLPQPLHFQLRSPF
jgi:hypothetical protein